MAEQKEKTPLQKLKERVGPVPKELQEEVKQQSRIKGKITKALKDGPKTVPEIAQETELPTQTVFWFLMSMKKYGKVAEGEQDGDYFKYVLVGKKK